MHLVKKLIAISVLLSASVQAQNILEFPPRKSSMPLRKSPQAALSNMKPMPGPVLSLLTVSSPCLWLIRLTMVP